MILWLIFPLPLKARSHKQSLPHTAQPKTIMQKLHLSLSCSTHNKDATLIALIAMWVCGNRLAQPQTRLPSSFWCLCHTFWWGLESTGCLCLESACWCTICCCCTSSCKVCWTTFCCTSCCVMAVRHSSVACCLLAICKWQICTVRHSLAASFFDFIAFSAIILLQWWW